MELMVFRKDELPLAEGTTIGHGLNLEEDRREAAKRRAVTSNLPTDVPKPKSTFPSGYGMEKGKAGQDEYFSKPIREDEANPALDTMGDPDFAEKSDDEQREIVRRAWKEIFGKDCPYEFDDTRDGEIQLEMARDKIERASLGKQ